jgi:drug/metabolite transporter (DMT)-like permease
MAVDRSNLIPILEATFAVIVWGASFVATKVALAYLSPTTVVWLRFAMGVVILGLAVWLRRQFSLPPARELLYLALLGFLGISFHQWLQSTALLTTQATNTAWIVATTPIFMSLLGWLVLRERLTAPQGLGIAVAAIGVVLVVSGGDLTALAAGQFGTLGDFLVLISSVNWAFFSALSRRGLRRYPATRMMFYVMGFGWLFISIVFLAGNGPAEIPALPLDGWLAVGFLGVFCSGLAYIFWFDALQRLPVAQTGAFIYFEPLVTLVVAAWVLSEPILLASIVGGVAILFGVWLVNRPQKTTA